MNAAAGLMDNDMRPLAGHSFTFKAEPQRCQPCRA
jgi:hypothetical protein